MGRRGMLPRLITCAFVLAVLAGGPFLAATAHPPEQPGARRAEKAAELSLRVNDTKQALGALELAALRFGMEELSRMDWSIQSDGIDYPYAALTLRVPVAKFEPALEAIHQIGGEVLSERITISDHTGELASLEARVERLAADRQRLAEIEKKPEDGDGAQRDSARSQLQERIKDVETELDSTSAQLRALREKVEWGSIAIELEPAISTPEARSTLAPTPGATLTPIAWDPAEAYQDALSVRGEWLGVLMCCTGMVAMLIVLWFVVQSRRSS